MDILPCLPDAQNARRLRDISKVAQDYVEKSVAITDNEHRNYRRITDDLANQQSKWIRGLVLQSDEGCVRGQKASNDADGEACGHLPDSRIPR